MHAVVTGATGCLGIQITQRLLAEGYTVTALGRNPRLGAYISKLGAQFIALEIEDLAGLRKICRTATTIYHCAALSSPWGRYQDFYQANVVGTQHVIAATPQHARLVHISTPSIYFDFTEKHHISEDAVLPKKPANAYVATKLLAERYIDEAVLTQGLNAITLRPRGIFGPFDRAIFPRVLNSERRGILPIIGKGHNRIDLTYVGNVAESMLLAANAPHIYIGKKYHITNDEPKTLLEILTLLYDALQRPLKPKSIPYPLAKWVANALECVYKGLRLTSEPALTPYTVGVLGLGQTLNIEAAKRDLNYQPQLSIATGIQQFVEGYGDADLSII